MDEEWKRIWLQWANAVTNEAKSRGFKSIEEAVKDLHRTRFFMGSEGGWVEVPHVKFEIKSTIKVDPSLIQKFVRKSLGP